MASTIEVNGLDRLSDQLKGISKADYRKMVAQLTMKIQANAKLLAPVSSMVSGAGELRDSIRVRTEERDGEYIGTCYTNKSYATYVEMGTGPKGMADHAGTAPGFDVAYTPDPWWIHEGPGENEVSRETGEGYHWFHIDTKAGRFYKVYGQAAQPFMYPAYKAVEGQAPAFVSAYMSAIFQQVGIK